MGQEAAPPPVSQASMFHRKDVAPGYLHFYGAANAGLQTADTPTLSDLHRLRFDPPIGHEPFLDTLGALTPMSLAMETNMLSYMAIDPQEHLKTMDNEGELFYYDSLLSIMYLRKAAPSVHVRAYENVRKRCVWDAKKEACQSKECDTSKPSTQYTWSFAPTDETDIPQQLGCQSVFESNTKIVKFGMPS